MSHFVNISSDFIELCQTLVPTPATCASFCPVDFFSPCASGRSIPTRLPGLEYPSYAAHANAPAVLADSWGVELVGRSDGCEAFSLGSEALFPNENALDWDRSVHMTAAMEAAQSQGILERRLLLNEKSQMSQLLSCFPLIKISNGSKDCVKPERLISGIHILTGCAWFALEWKLSSSLSNLMVRIS